MSRIIYGTTATLRPGGRGTKGRSDETLLNEAFPQSVTNFDTPQLVDVRVYYYKLYNSNFNLSELSIASEDDREANSLRVTMSPSVGDYCLRYGGNLQDPPPNQEVAQGTVNTQDVEIFVPVGDRGLPGTPFLPNVASPRGSGGWRDLPTPPERTFRRNIGYGVGHFVNVESSCEQQSTNSIKDNPRGELILGKSQYTILAEQEGEGS